MSFFDMNRSSIAVITQERTYKYNEIPMIEFVSEKKEVVLILCTNTIDTLSAYISAMNSEHAVMLLNADINVELLANIIEQYKPKWLIGLDAYDGYTMENDLLTSVIDHDFVVHKDLALLLSTSGTTGSQKFVRLSYTNLRANAQSIIDYLQIDENERAVMNLPLSYSYGMSIINSHLLAGASVLLTDQSIMEKSFWSFVQEQQATSLSGVPFTYQMLQRVGFMKMDLPNLRTLTQAGGRLSEKLVQLFGQYAIQHNKRFYVMYGQTEAAPRMSYIPPHQVVEKSTTIGIAIPNGEFSIDKETTELIYRGANVMMGYAEGLADLEKGDEFFGVLHTGDTATVDEDGFFTITGRMKRFIKLFGLRINLDDVEKKLEAALHIGVACTGNDDKLVIAIEQQEYSEQVKELVESLYKLHKTAYKVKYIEIPRFANGKIDYMTLKERCM